jgi:hypothetical protein
MYNFVAQAQVSAKPLQWHYTLAIMKVDLIHKPVVAMWCRMRYVDHTKIKH